MMRPSEKQIVSPMVTQLQVIGKSECADEIVATVSRQSGAWKKVKLGEVCSKIGSGATPKGGSTVYVNKGVAFIRSQNVYNLYFDYNGLVYITQDAATKLNGVEIKNKDVLLNITGDSVARTCIAPSNILPARVNQHVAIIRPNPEVLDPHFLNYYLASPSMQAFMLGLAVGKGASRNAMTKDMIMNFEVPCPPISIQHSITTTLSRYDNLIENYQRQIKLLEEAAQRLYKEWFVNLHFPGHENVKVIDGVPEGWEKKSAQDFLNITIGKTPPRVEKQWFTTDNDGVLWSSVADMKDTTFLSKTSERLTIDAVERFNMKLVKAGTILLSFKLTVGRVAIANEELCTNEAIAHFSYNDCHLREYTYLYLCAFNYDSLGNTSSISKAINSKIVKNMPFIMPPKEILKDFSCRTSPLFKGLC